MRSSCSVVDFRLAAGSLGLGAHILLEVGFLLVSELLQFLIGCCLCLTEFCEPVLLCSGNELLRLFLSLQKCLDQLLGIIGGCHCSPSHKVTEATKNTERPGQNCLSQNG